MTDGRELTISVQQSFPGEDSIITPIGGSWAAGTYSFKVVAWYWTDELDEDNAGVIRIDVPGWTATVDANDKVIITWSASERPPDHYSVYHIENASWQADGSKRGRKVAEVAGDVLTATIDAGFLLQGGSTNLRGFCTSEDGVSPSTILHDTNAHFITDGVKAEDTISNQTDTSTAFVVSVDSEIQLTTTALVGPGDNEWQLNDIWFVTSTTILVDDSAGFITNGIVAGNYVIINDGTANYAKILSVDSETQVTTVALTGEDTYKVADSYDIVLNIFVISTDAAEFEVNPIRDMFPTIREIMVRSYKGILVKKAYALASPLNIIEIELYTNVSISETNLHTILKWLLFGTRLRIRESSGANAVVTPIDGYFTNIDHLGNRYKNSRSVIRLKYEVELGTVT